MGKREKNVSSLPYRHCLQRSQDEKLNKAINKAMFVLVYVCFRILKFKIRINDSIFMPLFVVVAPDRLFLYMYLLTLVWSGGCNEQGCIRQEVDC